MKIVFIIPPFDYARSVGRKGKNRDGILPPLGVGCLAAMVEQAGHEAALVDAMAEGFDAQETAEAALALCPDIVGVSVLTTVCAPQACSVVRALRKSAPDLTIVMGGAHVTTFADQMPEQCPEADIFVPGDGELPLLHLLEAMKQNRALESVAGIILRGPGGWHRTPPAACVEDIDSLPPPARHIYRGELYNPLPSLSAVRPATTVITARGCPWARCRFCYQGGRDALPYRRRSPDNVIREIARLVTDDGIRNIVFWDDNFCAMPEWVAEFCALLQQQPWRVAWSVLARANSVSEAMLRQMATTGCYSIQFGFESGNAETLKLIQKGMTVNQYRDAVRWSRAAGLETRGTFMLGFPGETPEMSLNSIKVACELDTDYMLFFAYHVLPGTELEETARREGAICPTHDGDIHQPSYVPNTYPSAEALEDMVRLAYRRYYLRPGYIARSLLRVGGHPASWWNHAKAFAFWAQVALSGKQKPSG